MKKKYSFISLCLLAFVIYSCKQTASPEEGPVATEFLDTLTEEELLQQEIETMPEWDTLDEMLGLGKVEFGDLDSMYHRRKIRALVPYSKTFYYIDGKLRRGASFDVLTIFEKELNRRKFSKLAPINIVFIPVNRDQIIPLLEQGYGDIAVGGLIVTPEREEKVDFSDPVISGLKEIVVANHEAPKLNSILDLSGKEVYVHQTSGYFNSLTHLNDSLQNIGLEPVKIKAVRPYLEDEDILEMVNSGLIQYTIMVEDMAAHWSEALPEITIYHDLVLEKNVTTAWAFRKDCPQLKTEINHFIRHHKKGSLHGNILYKRYFGKPAEVKKAKSEEAMERLLATESLFKKYGEEYELDWLLLVAQGYQESGLNQNLRSRAGAVGIMQIKPSTAAWKPIGIKNVYNVDNNIHASAKYTRYIIDTYFSDSLMDPLNRHLFALAAYNAGPARVAGLRRRAAAQGLNPNVWFGNVELMAARSIGRETPQYVSNIYKYYASFRQLQRYEELSGKHVIP